MPATSTSSATTPIQHLGEQGGYFSNWANYSWAFTGSAATTVQNGLSVTVIETVKAGQSAFNWLYGTVKTIATIIEIEAERHEVKEKMTAAATYTAAIGMQALDMLSDKVAEVGSAALTELQVQAGHAGQALLSGAEAGLVMAKDKALEVGSAVLAELQVQAGHAGQALLSGVTAYSSYLRWSAAVEEGVLVAHSADDELFMSATEYADDENEDLFVSAVEYTGDADDELFMSATEYTDACEQVLMVGNDALNFAVMACA